MHKKVLALGYALAAASFASAADIHVNPGQSIQSAIMSAQDGDHILVHPGTYPGALDFGAKRIELVGVQGAAVTTIDATGSGTSAIRITHVDPNNLLTRVSGLTISGGSGSFANDGTFGGGGIILVGPSSALVESCVITNNHVGAGNGGGVLFKAGWCDLKDSTIDGNSAANGGGTFGLVRLTDCVVSNNLATLNGGGAHTPWTILRTTFDGNAATNGGGAYNPAYIVDQFVPSGMAGCFGRFVGNTASNLGGGVFLELAIYSHPAMGLLGVRRVIRCIFEANSAAVGGGAYLRVAAVGGPLGAYLGVTDCVFANNVAPLSDGAHIDTNGLPAGGFVDFSTFDGDGVGGSVHSVSGSILRNVAQPFASVQGAPPSIWYSNVPGGGAPNGNLDVDPQWINPGAGDYALPATSPCVDQVPADFGYDISTDLDGSARYVGGLADMGAIEIDTDCDADGIGDIDEIISGTATDCDFDAVPDNCQPLVDCDGDGMSNACEIASGLATDCNYNGVPDACEWSDCNGNGVLDACDIANFVVADCNSNGIPDTCEQLNDCDGEGTPDVCELATGQAGDCNANGIPDACDLASGASFDLDGNGKLDECQATLAVPSQHATIQAAIDAAQFGDSVIVADGVYSGLGNLQLDFKGKAVTIFSANGPDHCVLDGGGATVAVFDNASDKQTLRGFTFTGAKSTTVGGAVSIANGASPTFERCVFTNNAAPRGGAVAVNAKGRVSFVGCRFIENVATTRGGAVNVSDVQSEATFTHCTFVGNIVTQFGGIGGAIAVGSNAKATVVDSILWSNSAFAGNAIGIAGPMIGPAVTVSYCDVEGGTSGVLVGTGQWLNWGAGNIALDPQFADLAARDLHLKHTSPCRDTGAIAWAKDIEGDAQVGAPDIGADEFASHAYTLGEVSPGQTVTLRVIGAPGTTTVLELFGTTKLAPPIVTPVGVLYSGPPYAGGAPFVMPPIPADGVLSSPLTVPAAALVGATVYRQVFLGAPESKLTNLDVITIVP